MQLIGNSTARTPGGERSKGRKLAFAQQSRPIPGASLLPRHGHDAEFRRLEGLWPDAKDLDFRFDTLHEHWNTRKERYRTDIGP